MRVRDVREIHPERLRTSLIIKRVTNAERNTTYADLARETARE